LADKNEFPFRKRRGIVPSEIQGILDLEEGREVSLDEVKKRLKPAV